jgi:hypothetical protein
VSGNTVAGGSDVNLGGGIFNRSTLVLKSSTVSNNVASGGNHSDGGGINNSSGTTELQNSILAVNTSSTAPDCAGTIGSQGYNLVGDNTGCTFSQTTGDQMGAGTTAIDPKLGPLQDNGGPTLTQALRLDSPAIDSGGASGCLATDQRGVARPEGVACDIGAYEFDAAR